MTEAHLRLAADIDRRLVAIPFDRGPSSGVLLGGWRPAREGSSLPANRLKHATLYHVTDGKPGAIRLRTLRCRAPEELDPAAILDDCRRMVQTPKPLRMPPRPSHGLRNSDPFIALAWEREPDDALIEALAFDAASESPDRLSRGQEDAAKANALTKATERVRRCAATHFVGRLDKRSAEVMAFMRDRLPFFSWGAFRALSDDLDGSLHRFAERYPLIAGRALSLPAVAARAAGGDLEGAYREAMHEKTLGAWVTAAVDAHPALAGSVDGRRRGRACDRALLHVPTLPRDHVPDGPEDFAAFVDACVWATAVGGYYETPNAPTKVARMRGAWRKVVEACEAACRHGGETLSIPAVKSLFFGMSHSFEMDLVENALMLEGGLEGPKRHFAWGSAAPRPLSSAECIAYRGMNVPDRVRHAVRYAAAKPRIAAQGLRGPLKWKLFVAGALPEEWVRVSAGHEIRFAALGSMTSLNWRYMDTPPEKRGNDHYLFLPATTPDGRIGILYEERRTDGGPNLADRSYEIFKSSQRRARSMAAEICGLPDDADLGDALLRRSGSWDHAVEATRASAVHRERYLAAMQAAWGDTLPRRLRRLSAEDFRSALVSEFRATVPGE